MRVDLNCDLGEAPDPTVSHDRGVIAYITSANIACGGHAGNPEVMRQTVQFCVENDVVVGAHPGYRDPANFGRLSMDMSPDALADEVLGQIRLLIDIAESEGTAVRYVKPHGALYHDAASRPEVAEAVSAAILSAAPGLAVLAPPGALYARYAKDAGLPTFVEAFADRAYNSDGTLVSRNLPGSMITDIKEMGRRAVRLATEHSVRSIDGVEVEVRADSICLHGESARAVAAARVVASAMEVAGIRPKSFLL
ncbi:5-oxoprolinase subunit PxpA [soil metagenome]